MLFSQGGERLLPPPMGAHMGEYGICYKIHNIFGNYSSYNDIKRDSKMQPIEPFLKNFLRRAYTLEFTIIEIEQRYMNLYSPHNRQRKRDLLQEYLSIISKTTPMDEHGS